MGLILIGDGRRREPPRLEALFDEHAQGLFAFLVYRTGDRGLAEEIVADTFERVFKARFRFDRGLGSEKNWLYSIALNRLRDLQRRSAIESKAFENLAARIDDQSPTPMEIRVASEQDLHRAVRNLPPNERDALTLRFGGDLTVPEVAEVLGEPLSRVEGRVYRGLRRLREELKLEDPA